MKTYHCLLIIFLATIVSFNCSTKKKVVTKNVATKKITENKSDNETQLVNQAPKGKWIKLASIPQKDFLQIIPLDFAIAGEEPFVVVKQIIDPIRGGEHNKKKDFKIFKLNNDSWEQVRLKNASGQNWFGNLEANNGSMYLLYSWQIFEKYENGQWIKPVGDINIAPPPAKKSYSYYPDLKFDKNGKAYAIWADASFIEKGYLKGGSWLSCSALENNKWNWVGLRAFGKDCGKPKLAISNDKLYTLFKDYEGTVYKDRRTSFSMMVFENGEWNYLGKRAFSPGGISGTSFAFAAHNGVPYALFTYENKWTGPLKERINKITLMKFENNTWSHVGNLETQGAIYHVNLKINKEGIPYVAYVDNFRKIRIKKYNGTDWLEVGNIAPQHFTGTLQGNQYVRANQIMSLFFDLSETGVPYIVFTQTARVAIRNKGGDKPYHQIFAFKFQEK